MAGSNAVGDDASSLFQGKQFWLSQNIPQRSRFKELIQKHGGVIRLQEKDADIKLVDHARKNLPADSYSYSYVEASIQNGRLENLEAHRAGPSAARPVGATYIPRKGTRVIYTLEDDQFLWDRVAEYAKRKDSSVKGNKLYQELAAENPRHPWQSWRDRYLKRLQGRPRPGGMPQATDQDTTSNQTKTGRQPPSPKVNEKSSNKTDMDSSKPEQRKRKRTLENEASSSPSNDPDTSKRRATVKKPQEVKSASRQPESNAPENLQKQPTPARNATQQEPGSSGKAKPAEEPTSSTEEPENTVDSVFLELPFFPASPEPEETSEQPDVDAWIDDRLQAGKANELQVLEALRCTSMDPNLADKVLGYLVAGKSIPNDLPGVWTPEDDKCLEANDHRDVSRALEKHGLDFVNARWEYLSMEREAGFGEDKNN